MIRVRDMRGGGSSWEMTSTCVQGGGLPRPLGGYQPNVIVEPHSPSPAWQLHHGVIPKREPTEEERNDSGINSGSEFQSSSPGSENSQEFNHHNAFYQPPKSLGNRFNPEPTTSPKIKSEDEPQEDDPLRRLQMALEKNGMLNQQPSSPKPSENSMDDENKSDGEEYDEQGLRIPKMNSHGKVKTFKCKQCDFVAITKLDFWEHSKGHIKADKLLTCPKCPFVTEYKHHLEYHLRNHFGSKPFKCDKCSYSCVNKSMLNSHMKSHSNVYQYRCADCTYATKYCHSLKLHLRKYSHKPAMVLNPDGTPNPLPIIDVYGTRRGPKNGGARPPPQQPEEPQTLLQHPLAQLMMNAPFPYPFLGFPANPLMFPQFAPPKEPSPEREVGREDEEEEEGEETVLDLSKPEADEKKRRRKGKAFKLAAVSAGSDEDREEEVASSTEETKRAEVDNEEEEEEEEMAAVNNNKPGGFSCQYCNIAFGDVVLYTMHMGYHGYKDPFTCNMCGEQCNDKVSFFLHIARTPHS